MLVPITFKADGGESSKKGKIRAEDLSALFAFALPSKTGLLDILNKCDAYDVTASGGVGSFYLHSGYIVICGRIIYIEEATLANIALPSSGTVTGYFGVKVDLSSSASGECSFFSKTGTLVQSDLNQNPVGGVYEFPLYTYTATPSLLSFTNKVAKLIKNVPYSESATFTAGRDGTVDTSKTIDEKLEDFGARLTTVGFKSGDSNGISYVGNGVTITSKSIRRVGNFVIGKINCTLNNARKILFRLSKNFCPKSDITNNNITGYYGLVRQNDSESRELRFWNISGGQGSVEIVYSGSAYALSGTMSIMFGFEANPWED